MKDSLMSIEKLTISRLFIEKNLNPTQKDGRPHISAQFVLEKDEKVRFGIRYRQEGEYNALVEAFAVFQTKDFDIEDPNAISSVRHAGFGYLFPYVRSAFCGLFSLAGVRSPEVPLIYVEEVFGKIEMKKEA